MEEIQIEQTLYYLPRLKFSFKLKREEILKRQAEDLGDLLKNVPGITLKNYGGLGGLKTISARGINGTHTGIIVDGFLLQSNQTGQLDLGTIQVDNVQEIKFSYVQEEKKLQVVSAYFSASNLEVKTMENQFSTDTFQLRMNTKIGSFGQSDSYLSGKWNHKLSYVSAFVKYRRANGRFPFQIQNETQTIDGNRINNDLSEVYSGVNLGKRFKNNSTLRLILKYNYSDKGLPGAVILYNPTASQRLNIKGFNVNIDYIYKLRRILGRSYFSIQGDALRYVDSGYLNQQGYFRSDYYNRSFTGGIIFKKQSKKSNYIFGVEETNALLNGDSFFGTIFRSHSKLILDYTLRHNKYEFNLSSGFQHVYSNDIVSRYRKFAFTPGISMYARKAISFLGEIQFFAKRTFRIPTFNELYYGQIGNTNLKPEIANQSNLGSFYKWDLHKNKFKFTYNLFINYMENKIVAIPTKNLFIWSIQNVGKVWIYGAEFVADHERKFGENWVFNTSVNYTFQRVMDYSDPTSPTFRNQIAYIPQHLINVNISAEYKKTGINISSNYTSLRYTLNENISYNEVPAFLLIDCTVFMQKNWNANILRLSFSMKNIANSSYQYIRYFVMPGRNYLITLSYALH